MPNISYHSKREHFEHSGFAISVSGFGQVRDSVSASAIGSVPNLHRDTSAPFVSQKKEGLEGIQLRDADDIDSEKPKS